MLGSGENADGLRRSVSVAQPDRVGRAPAGVAAVPLAGVVGYRAAGAVAGAGQHPVVAKQHHGLGPTGVPALRDVNGVPRRAARCLTLDRYGYHGTPVPSSGIRAGPAGTPSEFHVVRTSLDIRCRP